MNQTVVSPETAKRLVRVTSSISHKETQAMPAFLGATSQLKKTLHLVKCPATEVRKPGEMRSDFRELFDRPFVSFDNLAEHEWASKSESLRAFPCFTTDSEGRILHETTP